MIIRGKTLAQVVKATYAVCPTAQVKMKPSPGAALVGYIRIATGTTYRTRLISDGSLHPWEPCQHFYKALMAKLITPPGSPQLVLHKYKMGYWSTSAKVSKALAKAGLECVTDCVANYITAGSVTPAAPVKPAPVYSGEPLTFPMLDGAPLEPGQAVNVNDVRNKVRPIYAITTSLYLLEECKMGAARIPANTTSEIPDHLLMRALHAVAWRNRVVRYAEHYANTLARQFFDYLTMASFGEARHAQGSKYTFDAVDMKAGRNAAYQAALRYDPRDLLPKLIHAFNGYTWGGNYGGEKWGKIAKTAALFFQPHFRNYSIVFVDHCVDLVHNGGLAFNKGYIIGNPSDELAYMNMLDEKRNGSLLDSTISHPITPNIADLLEAGVRLGLVRRPRVTFRIEDDVDVPLLTWGDKHIAMYDGHKSIKAVASVSNLTQLEDATHEVYPER